MENKYKSLIIQDKSFLTPVSNTELDLSKPSKEETERTIKETTEALEKLCNSRIKSYNNIKSSSFIKSSTVLNSTKILKYTPNNQNTSKIIQITNIPEDPFDNYKFKHLKVAAKNSEKEDHVPILHSPTKKITYEDLQNWKIPPCVSISKNPKGLVIPLDIRLANDGRNQREYKVNKNFSKLSDVLFIAEKTARQEIEERNRIAETIQIQNSLKKEEELKEAAKQARLEKKSLNSNFSNSFNSKFSNKNENEKSIKNFNNVSKKDFNSDVLLGNKKYREELVKEKKERDELRAIRKKEIERDRKIEIMNNYNKNSLKNRDISEKIALNQAQPNLPIVDGRIYNKEIKNDLINDEEDNIYDKALFNEKNNLTQIYKTYNNKEMPVKDSKILMEKIMQKGFEKGEIQKTNRNGPVQFEKNNNL